MKRDREDLDGQTFGRLTVSSWAGLDERGRMLWRCRCGCGQERVFTCRSLKGGKIQSCGCARQQSLVARNFKHGYAAEGKTPEYRAFQYAKTRCTNPGRRYWYLYGGRGVQFKFDSFEQFLAEIGPKPTPKHSLDRIDPYGNYEPGNIRWATPKEQRNNQRPRLAALALILLLLVVPSHSQIVTLSSNRIYVDGKSLVGIQDYLPSIAADGGLGFDGPCRTDLGDCAGEPKGAEKFTPLANYSKVFRAAGFNTFRVAVGANTDGLPVEQLIPVLGALKADGWAVWVTLFSFNSPLIDTQAGLVYLDTLYTKLSPYTDIWEITNESSPSVLWISQAVQRLRVLDTKHRPISTSWNDASYAFAMDINSPHWYYGGPDIPEALHNSISSEYFKMPGKPIVYGEIGNSGQNWSRGNVSRVHDFVSIALSEGVGLIFFQTGNAKDYVSGAANIYLGPEERAEVARLLGTIIPPPPRTINPIKITPRRGPCWLFPRSVQVSRKKFIAKVGRGPRRDSRQYRSPFAIEDPAKVAATKLADQSLEDADNERREARPWVLPDQSNQNSKTPQPIPNSPPAPSDAMEEDNPYFYKKRVPLGKYMYDTPPPPAKKI